jgi:hypothetical protein
LGEVTVLGAVLSDIRGASAEANHLAGKSILILEWNLPFAFKTSALIQNKKKSPY